MSEAPVPDTVALTIDGVAVTVPKGTKLIRAAEAAGIAVPRFCDHPLLDPMGSCRACLVEILDAGNGRGFPKPQSSCTTDVANGMVVKTQVTSEAAAVAQAGILEFLLVNHPLDCPICDKGGECPLQNQALANGRGDTRFDGVKRTYPKPTALSELILLDRERCVLCARCTRFADQIAGDPSIHLVERGAKQQIGIYPDAPFDSYFSGNVTQICPVGALTSADYRFSARPFDLKSTVTTCENCAAGCQVRVDARHSAVRRRLAGNDADVNEEWNCDKGRFGFVSGRGTDRVTTPLVRVDDTLVRTSWPEALAAAAAGLSAAKLDVGVIPGGRVTAETAYAYSRFARAVLHTNSIDFRTRPGSAEEADFLAAAVAGRTLEESVTYADLSTAKRVVLVGFEPEDEAPIVALRLRAAHAKHGVAIATMASYLSRGGAKLGAELIPTRPSGIPAALADLKVDPGTIILAGETLALVPGALSALLAAADRGARWAWVPRRAGELGAIEAGCLPGLLPGGRPVTDEAAREQLSTAWGNRLPSTPGLALDDLLAAARDGKIKALVVGGAELNDLADPDLAADALGRAFVVCLDSRLSDVAALADVVLPVDLLEETAGTYVNWEHRRRPVAQVNTRPTSSMSEIRVLAGLARALGTDLGFADAASAAADWAALPAWTVARPTVTPVAPPASDASGVELAWHRELLDDSRCLDGATALRHTARTPVARVSPATLREEGLATATYVRLTGPRGAVTFPLAVTPGMVDQVVWVPARAPGQPLFTTGMSFGGTVTLAAAADPDAAATTKEGAR